ncbi:calcium-binding protein [Caulobacter sp. LjRoot300]|uniref:calcium-binding protein n=1 Tax=Caulobacter sp. LjRoot300 TaxID=3342321 RepID=UPI003ED02386
MAVVSGTSADDQLFGGAGNDTVSGLAGDDVLYGLAGDDTLQGGDGNDFLFGAEGADTLDGGAGDDALQGDDGNDALNGGAGYDTVITGSLFGETVINLTTGTGTDGGGGADSYSSIEHLILAGVGTVTGSAANEWFETPVAGGGTDANIGGDFSPVTFDGAGGDDILTGGLGDDHLIGGDGADILTGGRGGDTVEGGTGDDLIYGGFRGDDKFRGDDFLAGRDSDTLDYSRHTGRISINGYGTGFSIVKFDAAGEVVGQDDAKGIERLIGSSGDDVLMGMSGGPVVVEGGAGNDSLAFGRASNGTLDGGDGDDVLGGWNNPDILIGGAGNDVLAGGGFADRLTGGAGADVFLYDGISDSSLAGGVDGIDLITDFQTGVDKVELQDGNGVLAVELSSRDGVHTVLNAYAPGEAMEIHLTGQVAYSDLVFGGAASQSLTGGGGGDNLQGGGGWDVLTGGGGGDALTGGYGNDTFRYLATSDSAPDAYDLITDFKTGVDGIDLKGVTPTEVSLVRSGTATFVFVNTPDGPMTIAVNGDVNGSDVLTHDGHGVYMIGDGGANTLVGGTTGDVIQAGSGDDVIVGGGGGDVLFGQAGADVFQYLAASDSNSAGSDGIHGFETGVDKINLAAVAPTEVSLVRSGGSTFLFANTPGGAMQLATVGYDLNGADLLGLTRGVFMIGDDTANTLVGGALNDVIQAGGGGDVVRGGDGGDAIWGGPGADVFKYAAASDSTSAGTDSIFDFQSGADRLDLTGVRTGASDVYGVLSSGGSTFVFVDLGGDGVGDMTIQLTNTASLQAGDILF